MFRSLVTLIVLLLTVSYATAQSPGANWQRVTVLPVGTPVHVNGTIHQACNFLSADDTTLTCAKGKSPQAKPILIPKSGITSVKIAHRTRSTLVTTGAGAAIGFGVGFAVGTDNRPDALFGPNFLRGALAGIFALFGALLGAPIGYFTDLTASTIYRSN